MKFRQTWLWILVAAALFAFIYFFQAKQLKPPDGPARILPEIKAAEVTALQVRPGAPGQLAIRAERQPGGGWQLTEPLLYPALDTNVERLVSSLENLEIVTRIGPEELRAHRNPDQEYGLAAPQASVIIQQGDYRAHLLLGSMTPPGDQVYLQIVGREGIYVTDAQWMTNLPKSPNDWRDRALVHEDLNQFDRVAVTNNTRAFVLQRDSHHVWRMTWPLNAARADNARIQEGLARLATLRVEQFVSEDPKADAESAGLAAPALELAFSAGTNTELALQFGKSLPAPRTNLVYARKTGKPSLFAVPAEGLAAWRSTSINDFRDPHLLTLFAPVASVQVRAEHSFAVELQTNNTWLVLPDNFPADPELVQEMIVQLAGIEVTHFTKDVVNPPDLPEFGLAAPARQYTLKCLPAKSAPGDTNCLLTELSFGIVTNQVEKVYVRRADESSVYAISTNDLAKLPVKSWQLRERKIWTFTENDVAGLQIHQHGKTRELVRNGPHQWAFAPGSQGIINDLAVEETIKGLARAAAVRWVARADPNPQPYGLSAEPYRLVIKLKNGQSQAIQLGTEAPSKNQYAATTLDGELWVFELSWIIYRDIASYLSIP